MAFLRTRAAAWPQSEPINRTESIIGSDGRAKGPATTVPAAISPRWGRTHTRLRHIWCFGLIINQIELETLRPVDSPRRIAVTPPASKSPIAHKVLPRRAMRLALALTLGATM